MRSATFWLRVAAWILFAIGPAHLMGHIAGHGAVGSNPTEVELFRLTRDYKFPLMGLERSYENIHDGMSLSMGVLAILAGLLTLVAARHAAAAPGLVRSMAIAGAGSCSVLAILNLVYTIPPPTVMFAASALAYLAAALVARAS